MIINEVLGDTAIATNFYFDHYQNRVEQNLIDDLTVEAIKMYGVDMIYMPRETIERDDIFGEDIISKFDINHMIEIYVESVDGFDGNDLMAKFGLQVTDQATFIISRRRFQEVVYGRERPMEGDLIYFPLSNSIFEVNFVEDENPFYQLGKLFSYKLTVELFTYSHEKFNTGYDEIDDINIEQSDERIIEDADNIQIQKETNEIVSKDSDSEYPNVADDNGFDPDSPFGGL